MVLSVCHLDKCKKEPKSVIHFSFGIYYATKIIKNPYLCEIFLFASSKINQTHFTEMQFSNIIKYKCDQSVRALCLLHIFHKREKNAQNTHL